MSLALNIIAKITLILAGAAVICILSRRASAAARHSVWLLATVSIVLLPFAAVIVPPLQLPVLPTTVANIPFVSGAMAISAVAPGTESQASGANSMTVLLILFWMLGAAPLIARFLCGFAGIKRLARLAHSSEDAAWRAVISEIAATFGLRTPVRLLFIDADVSPMTWGLRRPTVLLPASARRWTATRRRLVLAHEIAHIQRCDGIVQLFMQVACCIHWFNPLVWYVVRRERIERERACDDQVLSLGGRPEDYADNLIQVVRGLRVPRLLSVVALGMAQPSQLEARLVTILDSHACRRKVPRTAMVFLCMLTGLATLSVAGIDVIGSVPLPPIGALTQSLLVPPQVVARTGTLYAAIQGTVTLDVSVDAQGKIDALTVISGINSDLDEQAIAAARNWRFAPALKDGVPVAATTRIAVDFRLPAGTVRISDDVRPPTVISRVDPEYTDEARSAHAQGTVVLHVIVHKDGSVEVIRVVRTIGFGLDQKAIAALKQWVFRPANRDGVPVDVAVNIAVNFNLR